MSGTLTGDRIARAVASMGAQVILDFNKDGSMGARGGAGATVEENTALRDAHLVAIGLNPVSPSGPPPMDTPDGHATLTTSLAAGA